MVTCDIWSHTTVNLLKSNPEIVFKRATCSFVILAKVQIGLLPQLLLSSLYFSTNNSKVITVVHPEPNL